MAAGSRSVVRALLWAMLGVGLLMGLAFPPVVMPFAEFRPGTRLLFAALCVGAGLVVGAANFLLVRAFLLRPVRSVTAELAALATGEGAAAGRVTFASDDEIGRLVERFNELLERLRDATREVLDIGGALARDTGASGKAIRALAAESVSRSQVVEGTVRLHERVAQELHAIGANLDRLGLAARETVAAVARQLELAEDADRRVGELQATSGRTAEGAGRIARAAQRTSASVRELSGAIEGAAASTSEAAREQERGLVALDGAAEAGRGSAAAIARGAEALLGEARRIRAQADGVGAGVESSGAAIRTGLEQTELLTTTVETVRDLDARERAALARLEREAAGLEREARALLAGIARIRPRGGGGDADHRPRGGSAGQDRPGEGGAAA